MLTTAGAADSTAAAYDTGPSPRVGRALPVAVVCLISMACGAGGTLITDGQSMVTTKAIARPRITAWPM